MAKINWNPERINRYKSITEKTIYSKRLCTCEPIDEAIKIFNEYTKKHPKLNLDDIHFRISEVYYGNEGGISKTFVIYRKEIESEEDYQKRISKAEDELKSEYKQMQEILKDIYEYALG